ncbi:MAG: ECF-type sigma factor [Nitrososphaeraceae archaeon]
MRKLLPTVESKALKSVRGPKLLLSTTPKQDLISFRRNKVNQLRLQGYANKEIAKKLHLSLSAIEKDIHFIREKSRSWFRTESIKDYCVSIYDSISLCDIKIEELRLLGREKDNLIRKIKILDEIRKTEAQKMKLYEKTGAIQKFLFWQKRKGYHE